ncbi:SUKH-4 family immunity protein [Streptomyces varsoviensis]|uniref:SUKH-4 family immunity protein n=1 Tax=Streptomyces varsoviensis TaxID=67373 RepID=UPI0033C469BF
MVTFAQAQERAEGWVNGDVPAYQHREVRVREFDLGFVAWAEDREDGPAVDGGSARLVIARDSGETTLWPGLPVGEVIRRYEEEYGAAPAPEPAEAGPPKRVDLEVTSFLLTPPEWLQQAADEIGIPDRRPAGSAGSAGAASSGAAASRAPEPSASSASSGAAVAGGAEGGAAAAAPVPPGGPDAWPAPASSVPTDEPAGSGDAPGAVPPAAPPASAGATPWAGADTNAGRGDGDDRSVAPPATVFAPPLSGTDGDDTPPSGVRPEAKTELLSRGGSLPPTAIAPAQPSSGSAPAPASGEPGAPGAPAGGYVPTQLVSPPDAEGGGPGAAGAAGAAGPAQSRPSAVPGVPGTPAGPGPQPPAAPGASGSAAGGTPPPAGAPGAPSGPGGPGGPGGPAAGAPQPPAGPAYPPTVFAGPGAPEAPPYPAAPGQAGHRSPPPNQPSAGPTPPAPPGRPAPAGPMPPGGPGAAQGQPGAPGSGGPNVPGQPAAPGAAGSNYPGASGAPGQSGAPSASGRPNQPSASNTPSHPAPPGAPGTPGTPPPGAPGTPPPGPGVHAAATMLAGPGGGGAGGSGAPGAGPMGPPPQGPPVAGVAPPPGAYGYPPQPPTGQPTVGPGYMAVLRYRAQDGSEQQLIRRSAPGTPHPEWQILHELRAMNVPPQQVLELHTELESCDLPGGYCARMVRETWPQVRVSHTAAYGRDHATRQQGVRHLVEHQGELHQVADGPARPAPNRAPLPLPGQVQAAPPIPPEGIAQELLQAFGPQGVFRFDQRAVSRQGVPDVVAQTLVRAGLPFDFGPFFWAQAQPGRPVPTLAELAAERGVRSAPDSGSYLVMGSDFGRQLCVQYGTAHIVAVPVEAGADGQAVAPQFVNSGLPEFVRCLAMLGRMWRLRYGLTPEQAGRWTVDFQAQLAALDPAALSSPENWWSVLLEQMWDGLF